MRAGNLQSTGNAGPQPGISADGAHDLAIVHEFETDNASRVTATPVIADGLLVMGDWGGRIYVIDLQTRRRLVVLETGADRAVSYWMWRGMLSTPVIADVTVPDGDGTREERRVYFGVNSGARTLWCLNLSAIAAERETLDGRPTDRHLCTGAKWPRSLRAAGSVNDPVFRTTDENFLGSPIFAANQRIRVGDHFEVRDVLYSPTTGGDCANGQFWALDAYTGEVLWTWDPVVNGDGEGGVVWTKPAMNREQDLVYVTTGDCVQKPQLGEYAESLVALHADTGHVAWSHQRRFVDTADLDVGNGPSVADVEGPDGCRVVLSPDKDGCVYAFRQQADLPTVGDPAFDPLRPGQQRLVWRRCFVPGSLDGGFNAMTAAIEDRTMVLQASASAGHAESDDANAFAVDVCTGDVRWASSSIGGGRHDAALASGLYFQIGEGDVQVVRVESGESRAPDVVATIDVPGVGGGSSGGGGIAIAHDEIYVPTARSIIVLGMVRGSNRSKPIRRGSNRFAGPYPDPVNPVLFPFADEVYDGLPK
jgi:outer membrane protein assembly factor BamB